MTPAARRILLALHFVCPLIFFTDLTRNPYITQIALLNVALAAAAFAASIGAWRAGGGAPPRTALDAPLAAWVAVCALSWAAGTLRQVPFFRDPMRGEGLKAFGFLIVNCCVPFYLAAAQADDARQEPRLPVGRWAAFFALWGASWLAFPYLRLPVGPIGSPWQHVWDPAGAAIWAMGLAGLFWLARRATLHEVWHAVLGTAWLASVYGVCQYFSFDPIWPKLLNPYGGRCVSTFGNPNFLSSYLVLAAPLAAAYYLEARRPLERALYALCLLTFEAALLSTLTRSSWFGVALSVGLLALSGRLRRLFAGDLRANGLVACLAAAMALAWPQSTLGGYTATAISRLSEGARALAGGAPYSPLYQRVLIWTCCWLMGAESPLLGKGWGTLELFYPFYQGPLLEAWPVFRFARTHANNGHNELAEIWAQAGLLGLGAALWLWWTFLRSARGLLRERPGAEGSQRPPWVLAAAAGAAGMLLDNMLNVSIHFAVPGLLFWWQAGAAAGFLGRPRAAGGPGNRPAAAAAALSGLLLAATAWHWLGAWNREAYYFLGFKAAHGGALPQAVELLERAHRWQAREVNTDYELANAYARSGQEEKAVWAFREALAANPGYDEIHFNLATVLLKKGDREGAIRHYRAAWAINPLSPLVYQNLGSVYLSEAPARREEAIDLISAQVRMFPENIAALNDLGYLYSVGKEPEKAEELYGQALRRQPELAVAERNLRVSLRLSKRAPPALLADLDAFHDLEARIRRRDYGGATLALARRLRESFPNSPACLFYAGSLELNAGNLERAAEVLSRAAALDPKHVPLRLNLATAYARTGRLAQAKEVLRATLELDPGNDSARRMLGMLERDAR